jgi:hypothetical protein
VNDDTVHPLNTHTALLAPALDHVCTCVTCRRTWTPNRFNGADESHEYYTPGPWQTEVESEAALDHAIEATGMFIIYRQVRGHYISPRPDTDAKSPRIDRLLLPSPRLQALGWEHGIVGIECKRSGEKIGRPISQMLDYSRALWAIGDGAYVHCKWMLLWPLQKLGGPLASVMAQNRLGGVMLDSWNGLSFHSGGSRLARFKDGTADVRPVAHGSKVGSR